MTETQGPRRRDRRRLRRHARGQPSADARRRRHHVGQPPRRSSSSGSGCTSSWPATTTRRSTTARCSARASSWSSTAPRASTPPPARCELASGRALDYDYVIYAVGSTGEMPSSVPGAAEFAVSIAELESAQRLRATLDDLRPDAPVTVVGAGLTGIETAAELAEQGRKVTLVCGGILAPSVSAPPADPWPPGCPPARCRRARGGCGDRGPGRTRSCFADGTVRGERTDHLGGRLRRAGVGGGGAACALTSSADCSPTRR